MALSINYAPLEQAQSRLDVLGKNIANVGTSGYKKFSFSDDLKSAGAVQDFTQGTITSTNKPLDLAITGDSLFRVEKAGVTTYSRNGQFSLSKENYIVDAYGSNLTGYGLDGDGNIDKSQLVALTITKGESKPKQTTNVGLNLTLDSRVDSIASSTKVSPSDPKSFNYSTFVTVYDKLGTAHTVQAYLAKRDSNTDGSTNWDTFITYDGDNTKPVEGKVTFNSLGVLVTPEGSVDSFEVTGANSFSISLKGSQQRGSSFSSQATQDGLSAAALTGYSVDQNGFINANYANGTNTQMGQIVLAKFNNFQGLKQEANNQWSESPESGAAQIGLAGDPKFGSLQGGALESSNVDITVEMVKLISAQRAFQSAAEVLKKQDEILQNINNISR
jgi:flagellar hook protein FlgE